MNLEVVWPLAKDHYLTIPADTLQPPQSQIPSLSPLPRDVMYQRTRAFFSALDGRSWWTPRQIARELVNEESDRALAVIGLAVARLVSERLLDRRESVDARAMRGSRPFEYRWRSDAR